MLAGCARPPISGKTSLAKKTESPMRRSACQIFLPLGSGDRNLSSAPNARFQNSMASAQPSTTSCGVIVCNPSGTALTFAMASSLGNFLFELLEVRTQESHSFVRKPPRLFRVQRGFYAQKLAIEVVE